MSIVSFDLTPEAEAMASYRYVITNSSESPSPGFSYEHPFLLKGMLFGICLKGESRLKIDLREYVLKPNTVFIVLPNRIIELLERSEEHFVEVLFFSIDFMNNLPLPKDFDVFNKMKYNPCLEISDENMKELLEYHSFIAQMCDKEKHVYRKEVAKSLLCALIALIGSFYLEEEINTHSKINSRSEEIVEEFSDLLMQYRRKERNASFYADKMYITTQYLSRTLKKISGKSINYWINEAVILDAKVLLKSSNMTVVQISEELNFPNPSFFGRFFKQYAGITPLKYREG